MNTLSVSSMEPIIILTFDAIFSLMFLILSRKISRNSVDSALDHGRSEGRKTGGPKFQIKEIKEDFMIPNVGRIREIIASPMPASTIALSILRLNSEVSVTFSQLP